MKLAFVFLFIGLLTFLISGFVSGTWDPSLMDPEVKAPAVTAGVVAMVFSTLFKDEL